MELMTIPETAIFYGCSRQWIWMLVKQGRLPAKRVGGVYVIRAEELPENLKIINSKNKKKEITDEKSK